MTQAFALAIGIGTKNSNGDWLEVYYPQPLLNPAAALIEAAKTALGYEGGNVALEADGGELEAFAVAVESANAELAALARTFTESERPVVLTVLETDAQSVSTPEVYLKRPAAERRLDQQRRRRSERSAGGTTGSPSERRNSEREQRG